MNRLLWAHREYRLARLVGEADALLACRPDSKRLLNACCIVRGYVELFPHYKAFPWEYVKAIVGKMRLGVIGQVSLKVRMVAPHAGPFQPENVESAVGR